jgi:hypothetical protein
MILDNHIGSEEARVLAEWRHKHAITDQQHALVGRSSSFTYTSLNFTLHTNTKGDHLLLNGWLHRCWYH